MHASHAFRRLKRLDIAGIRIRLYAGLGLEAGNVFTYDETVDIGEFRVGGHAFIGAETPIGPVYLGYGYTDGGRGSYGFPDGSRDRWFLSIGDHF